MKNFIKGFGLLTAALVLQSTAIQMSFLKQIHPDLILLCLVYISLRYGPVVGVFSGFSIGLIQDVYAVEMLGAGAFCKSLVGYGVGLFDESRFSFSAMTKVIFLLAAFFVHDIVFNYVIGLPTGAFAEALMKESLLSGIFTVLLGTVVFYYLSPRPKV